MVREWLTQYFKGADNVSDYDRYFAELEEKYILQNIDFKNRNVLQRC
jgi:hypothetical protein